MAAGTKATCSTACNDGTTITCLPGTPPGASCTALPAVYVICGRYMNVSPDVF